MGADLAGEGGRLDALVLHEDDDVATALRPLAPGERVTVGGPAGRHALELATAIPLGHKLALRPLPEGWVVRKYGEAIGRLRAPVAAGAHVHVHNLETMAFGRLPGAATPEEA